MQNICLLHARASQDNRSTTVMMMTVHLSFKVKRKKEQGPSDMGFLGSMPISILGGKIIPILADVTC